MRPATALCPFIHSGLGNQYLTEVVESGTVVIKNNPGIWDGFFSWL